MSSHIITPGPYRATKLWNEVTRLFRSGMPLRKHRQSFRVHATCFTAAAAVDWLHQLLRSNSNFGPDVTRQQTVQLLKKFLKNHVIEDVKGRWGSEDLEDNGVLYRFPSTSPLKPIPSPAQKPTPAPGSVKRSLSIRDKEGLFRFRSAKKQAKETQENLDPALQAHEEVNQPIGEQQAQKRELTVDDEHEVWKDITLTHLQKILGITSLDEVLDRRHLNPQNIIHNMTRVNKHGVVTLDDKTDDLPHWVLSAMKSLANWPKYDSGQPSYPGFERDVFKTVSDYFYSLPQPLLTYQLYELFINVLVLCGCITVPPRPQFGKRKMPYPPCFPPPAKTSFRSTECLLLSLIRRGSCDEAESPMKEVFGDAVRSQLRSLTGGEARRRASLRDGQLGGSCASLSQSRSSLVSTRLRPRSCSMDNVLDDSAQPFARPLFLSNESPAPSIYGTRLGIDATPSEMNGGHSKGNAMAKRSDGTDPAATATVVDRKREEDQAIGGKRLSVASLSAVRRPRPARPHSMASCLGIVMESREEVPKETMGRTRATSCLNVSAVSRPPPPPPPGGDPSTPFSGVPRRHTAAGIAGSNSSSSTSSSLWSLHGGGTSARYPIAVRRCHSSLDLSGAPRPPESSAENSLLQPQCERMAIEALQLCTLLLPPTSRRKLQLLMRMTSRISQNVDMPRLHHAIGTRTLMVHTFSGCVLGSAEECDLDELLATRLVSFLMDHQDTILSVPEYLLAAVTDHIQYLRSTQLPAYGQGLDSGDLGSAPVLLHAFCRQISSVEFEQQRLASSQKAMEELLQILLTDRSISDKDRRKRLKQFQKQYPDIYNRQIPPCDREEKSRNKPKIKPPLLTIRKTKAFSIRN